MRIGVVGNCQAAGFSACISRLRPDDEICTVSLNDLKPFADFSAQMTELAGCDLVLTQFIDSAEWGALRTAELQRSIRRLVRFPAIVFAGFHPDCVYLTDAGGSEIRGATGPYHSAIAVACFLEGISVQRALKLYNALTYGSLGYFADYDREVLRLEREFSTGGYDARAAIQASPPVFMHTLNHPRIELLFALAEQVVVRVGLQPLKATLPPDTLSNALRWAVHPEISRQIGKGPPCNFALGGQEFSLETMLSTAYSAYERTPPDHVPPSVMRARAFVRQNVLGHPAPSVRRTITVEDVRTGFRVILGREAEEAAIDAWMRQPATTEDLRQALFTSREFAAKYEALRAKG
ncbi:WcbI family polysaccharide biosynthesis putative acetyltransferase [Roseomonas sp. AR75]|uniref:WcbI family polysaccharide biosynthesis putative acetyltransferase n=1 Tax=Roseomonas sp. AR75 TaxID=2562311 RepID=UPI0010C0B5AE|nr:WcbI family polysaccharide biosynthesis putative acetyltransferase [Roseomonas sp. AR75]